MSEDANVNPPIDTTTGETAGQLLRKAREASGLHVAALAVAIKVPVKKLEALEADRYAELPDAVFVRALAASVCRTLKVDATPILSKLPPSTAPRFEARDPGVHMPIQGHGFFHELALGGMLRKPPVFAVIGLLLAAVAVVFWPSAGVQESQGEASQSAASAEAPPPLPSPANGSEQSVSINGASGANPAPMAAQEPVAAASAAAIVPVISASAPIATDAIVSFKASAAAWVRVSDSLGAVVFEKTLAVGETAGVGGMLPLSVVVGNAAATVVEVRGQPYGLDPVSKNNVARFEVK